MADRINWKAAYYEMFEGWTMAIDEIERLRAVVEAQQTALRPLQRGGFFFGEFEGALRPAIDGAADVYDAWEEARHG